MVNKSIIVDDELNNVEYLQRLLQQYFPRLQVVWRTSIRQMLVRTLFSTGQTWYYLDIQMPGGIGFDLPIKFSRIDFEVIFITAHDQYGYQGHQILCSTTC